MRSCCWARQRCWFVSGAGVSGMTIAAGVSVSDIADVAATPTVGSIRAVVRGIVASTGVACMGDVLGAPFAVKLGSATLLGDCVDRTCVWDGAPICSG